MTTIVLWRHGVTDWNAAGRFQGANCDNPMNAEGQAQALAAAPVVAAWQPTTIVSSPLLRARQTADYVAALTGVPVMTDDRLKEIDVGTWSGWTIAEALADPTIAAAHAADQDYRRGVTGETVTEVGVRAGAALRDWATEDATVLVVAHGRALQMGAANLLGWDYAQSRALSVMDNCAISVLISAADRWRIRVWNSSPAHWDNSAKNSASPAPAPI